MHTRLELAAVSKTFRRSPVLSQIWLQVRGGEAVGLVGVNGAGKTTMLRIAAGLEQPDAGCVRWFPVRSSLLYFGGESTLPAEVSVARWARFFGVTLGERRRFGRLSRGTRQQLGLRVLLGQARAQILLLDEPWEGLDPEAAVWLRVTLRRWIDQGSAALISSHRLHDLASACTRFVLLENGRCHALPPGADVSASVSALSRGVRRV